MSYPTKEENILRLFFNEPTHHWHFNNIAKNANISQQRANYWLKRFIKDRIIKYVKKPGKMPYYVADFESYDYKNKKKLYALNRMFETGLLNHLQSLEKAKTVVIFGSFSRADWHTDSDIDVFIYGDPGDMAHGMMWEGLKRDVSVHTCRNKKEINEIRSNLLNNVMKGYFIKGSVFDLMEAEV